MKIPSYFWVVATLILGVVFVGVLIANKNNDFAANIKLPIVVDEYLDYNCIHCAEFEKRLVDIKAEFGDKIQVNQKNYPFLAANSTDLAYASEAARKQNKFDEYSVELFKWAHYSSAADTGFTYSDEEKALMENKEVDTVALAQFIKLDVEKFKTDIASDEIKNIVKSQKTEASQLGVSGTPTIYIFGQKYPLVSTDPNDPESPYKNFRAKLQEYITTAQQKK